MIMMGKRTVSIQVMISPQHFITNQLKMPTVVMVAEVLDCL